MNEVLRKDNVKVAIFRRDGNNLILEPKKHDQLEIESAVKQAMDNLDEIRWYYWPKYNFEIIKTALPPNYMQPWHSHAKIQESTYVIKGKVSIFCKDKENEEIELEEGDCIVLKPGKERFHTMKNDTRQYAITLTFKLVELGPKDESRFRKDWYPMSGTDLKKMPPEHQNP
jgi:quercetin dioxygenase-like cupin family protein